MPNSKQLFHREKLNCLHLRQKRKGNQNWLNCEKYEVIGSRNRWEEGEGEEEQKKKSICLRSSKR